MYFLEARDLAFRYESPNGWIYALQNFSIQVNRNEFVCIVGPSGCGKSTFIRIVAGLLKPTEGKVWLDGMLIEGPGSDRAVVFQEPALFPWLTALGNVEFGLLMNGWGRNAAYQRAIEVLRVVGLEDFHKLYPYQLSGGMRHRVAVARAWALTNVKVLLMDEPFAAADAITRAGLQDYLINMWLTEPRTIVYVTHDIEEAIYLADRVVILTPRPARVASLFPVNLPRPRDRSSYEFVTLRAQIIAHMKQLMGDVGQAL
jgi:NitT/TauT family transport system ATP-binding protein